jgi:hypothetical protein
VEEKTRRRWFGTGRWQYWAVWVILWGGFAVVNVLRVTSTHPPTSFDVASVVVGIVAVGFSVAGLVLAYRHRNDPKQGGDGV